MAHLVRDCTRDMVFASAMYQRLGQLDEVNQTIDREVHDLLEQINTLRAELSEAKEEKDVLRAQLSSMEEEEKNILEEERSVLRAQLASGKEERGRMLASRVELESECRVSQVRIEGLRKKVLDATGRLRLEEELRSKAFREECLKFACDLAISILKRCHNVCVLDGSEGPSFQDYVEPMLPSELGLSLEEKRDIVEKKKEVLVDEMLDLSSDEEEDVSPLSSPTDPAIGLSPADPVVGLPSPPEGSK
ncbi:hypothetical protein K2173_000780 [Erythroxylum novogranatense]|uniref:Uncharacterized protein n=1 Tax=Erythroxylum novogranatense TaxID=1862640 RepID=A0AAV8T3Z8_9ROSI|nr:hypothetical protein K2173_000780 [Erythroxylum novogranatense]